MTFNFGKGSPNLDVRVLQHLLEVSTLSPSVYGTSVLRAIILFRQVLAAVPHVSTLLKCAPSAAAWRMRLHTARASCSCSCKG